jgi:hypothetical protein
MAHLRPTARSRRVALYAIALFALVDAGAPRVAAAQSGLRVARDADRVLVSKDVGGERWAITRQRSTGSVTGNVFAAGASPSFIDCDEITNDGTNVELRCFGAGACPVGGACDPAGWQLLATVTLPLSFFEPGGSSPPPPEGCTPYTCPVNGAQVCFDQLLPSEQHPYDFGRVSFVTSSGSQSSVTFAGIGYNFFDPAHFRRQADGTVVLEDTDPVPVGISCGPTATRLTSVRVVVRPEPCGQDLIPLRAGSFRFVGEGGCQISGQFAVGTALP